MPSCARRCGADADFADHVSSRKAQLGQGVGGGREGESEERDAEEGAGVRRAAEDEFVLRLSDPKYRDK